MRIGVKERGAGPTALQRRESAEPVPAEVPAEPRHAAERRELLLPAEPDLVGCPALPRGVRPISVVPDQEVSAVPVDLAHTREEPHEAEDRLLEGAEDALAATVGESCQLHPMRAVRPDASG